MLADIPLPVGTIAAHEQASINQTGNVLAHRGAGHAVQPLADRLVGREDDHFCVPAKRVIRKEAEKPLQNGQIALGNPEGGLRLGQLTKEVPLVDGLAGTDASCRSTTRRWACEMGRINGEIGVYSMVSFTKAKFAWPANRFTLREGARSLHSEVRKLSFVAGWSRAKPKKGLVKLASRGFFPFLPVSCLLFGCCSSSVFLALPALVKLGDQLWGLALKPADKISVLSLQLELELSAAAPCRDGCSPDTGMATLGVLRGPDGRVGRSRCTTAARTARNAASDFSSGPPG